MKILLSPRILEASVHSFQLPVPPGEAGACWDSHSFGLNLSLLPLETRVISSRCLILQTHSVCPGWGVFAPFLLDFWFFI